MTFFCQIDVLGESFGKLPSTILWWVKDFFGMSNQFGFFSPTNLSMASLQSINMPVLCISEAIQIAFGFVRLLFDRKSSLTLNYPLPACAQ